MRSSQRRPRKQEDILGRWRAHQGGPLLGGRVAPGRGHILCNRLAASCGAVRGQVGRAILKQHLEVSRASTCHVMILRVLQRELQLHAAQPLGLQHRRLRQKRLWHIDESAVQASQVKGTTDC